ncbi:hypothetical protein [Winogradskyella pacifica]|uniref:hypothetical protein n=1 Tax=Winogradskyella pacifica TaxID=664642 RepID=UPI0015C6A191|nr:hypothetical protein [Winogradskyella pacifica]
MNKTSIFLLFYLLFFLNVFSQNRQISVHKDYYVPKTSFKEKYKPIDSIGYLIRDGDTLIKVPTLIQPKGTPVPYEYKDSTFLEYYKKIAFNPIHKDSSDTKPMKYWKAPIKIYFSETINNKVIRDFMKFTKLLDSKIDSLSISRVKELNEANYIIYDDNSFQYEAKLNSDRSDYWIYWNNKNQINKSFIRIVNQREFSNKLAAEKMKDLFFSTLGWFRKTYELGCDSYFSNCYSENKYLSEFDEALLKYHYSYGICKGTTRTFFEEQHRTSKKILENHHTKILIYQN